MDSNGNRGGWENLGTSAAGPRPAPPNRRGGGAQPARLRRWWRRHRLRISTTASVLLVLVLGGIEVLGFYGRFEVPPVLRHPLVPILLTLLILFFALQSYRQALNSSAFYRRFVRPGLRHLLELEEQTLSRGEKLFRPHQSVVMKIDVEGYTFLTYDMPYGMRRLFLDLWFTMVDDVLARDIFFDKSLGDGSLYLFDAEQRPDACRAALRAALRVRDETVPRFDRIFHEKLGERLRELPELRVASELYFERYRERAGTDFWQRSTVVRIALVAGCVDEGLWGLSSQSHYDVQGTPLVLVARLEQAAASGEILLDRSFVEALELEVGKDRLPPGLEPREIDIKGIGDRRVWVLPPSARRNVSIAASDSGEDLRRRLPDSAPERGRNLEPDAPGALGL